jgi:hypothetical protein
MTHTDPEIPVACRLSASDAGERQAEWAALLERATLSRTRANGRVRVAFAPLVGVREELQRLVAAEQECCPFLDLALEGTGLVLTGNELAQELLT